jgi:hypothetical protein
MEERLEALKIELDKGRAELAALDRRRAEVRDTLLRITGAIQVLTELLAERRPTARVVDLDARG